MNFQVTLPNSITIEADDETAAFFKLARFFGKFADGERGDGPDVAGVSMSGLDVTIVEVA